MKVPLLEFLDKLESTVKAAPRGDWSAPQGGWPSSRYGEVVSNEQPTTEGYGGKLIAESCDRLVAPHIVATQPKNVLALITKIRHLVLIGESETRSLSSEARTRLFLEIEVPE